MKNITITKNSVLPTLNEVNAFESSHKFSIPEALIGFWIKYNPISVLETLFNKDDKDYWLSNFYPFNEREEVSIQFVQENLGEIFENQYLAFADDAGGWQFVISLKQDDYGKVYFCRMDLDIPEALTLLADNFEEFINGLEKPTYE